MNSVDMYTLYKMRREISPYLEKDMMLVDPVFIDAATKNIQKFAAKWGLLYPHFVVYVNYGKRANFGSDMLTPIGGTYFGGAQILVGGVDKLKEAIPPDTVLDEIASLSTPHRKFVYKVKDNHHYVVLQRKLSKTDSEDIEVYIGSIKDYLEWRLVYMMDDAWSYYAAEKVLFGEALGKSSVWVVMKYTNEYSGNLYIGGSHRARMITYIGDKVGVDDDSVLLSSGWVDGCKLAECERDKRVLKLFKEKLVKEDGRWVFPVNSEEDALLLMLRLGDATG